MADIIDLLGVVFNVAAFLLTRVSICHGQDEESRCSFLHPSVRLQVVANRS